MYLFGEVSLLKMLFHRGKLNEKMYGYLNRPGSFQNRI